ncbi:MAG: hypothetical protein AcusKO_01510 [Acuticoccus sp.]
MIYRGRHDNAYFGRTMELTIDLPYQLVFLPAKAAFRSHIEGHPPLTFEGRHAFVAIAMPARAPAADAPLTMPDLKALEGLNDSPQDGGGHLEVAGLPQDSASAYATEYTAWTALADLDRQTFYVRDHRSLNFSKVELSAAAGGDTPGVLPLATIAGSPGDVTARLTGATAPA